jgi:hypothetical protein
MTYLVFAKPGLSEVKIVSGCIEAKKKTYCFEFKLKGEYGYGA